MSAQYRRFRSLIAAALDPRFYPIDWLDEQIAQERALCLATDEACVVIEIRTYPGGAREVHGLVAAGIPAVVVDVLIPAAEEFGRINGCQWGAVESRAAWVKLLQPHGYRVHQTTLRKEL